MSDKPKTTIFFVEGDADEVYLRHPFKVLLEKRDQKVFFVVAGTDLTSGKNSTQNNIVQQIESKITKEMSRIGLDAKDVSQIVQITDLDGTYIPNADVHPIRGEDQLDSVVYLEEGIYANRSSRIQQRNARKASNMEVLLQQSKMLRGRVPYRLYYMSCNIEHALLGSPIATKDKLTIAKQKRREWSKTPERFVHLVHALDHGCHTWEESWSYVKRGCNSLKRGTNLRFVLPEDWWT